MNFLHITFSLANILAFVAIGSLIAYFVQKDWKKLHKVPPKKIIIATASFACVGGLAAVLVNGFGQLNIAISNMFVASFFAIFAIASFAFSSKIKS